jgi:hypothetical protein
MKKITLTIIFACFVTFIFGQSAKIDSLLNLKKNAKNDTIRGFIYLELGTLIEPNSPDSAISYYKKAIDLMDFHISVY